MNVQPVDLATVEAGPGLGQQGALSGLDSRQTFMQLLVAQLKNQDPLNPMEGTDMVNQLATISTVEHLESIRQLLGSIHQGQALASNAFASHLLGKVVGLEGTAFALTGQPSDLSVGYRLPDSGQELMLTLLDSLGTKVAESIQRGAPGEQCSVPLSSLFGSSLAKGSYRLSARTAGGEFSVPDILAKVSGVVLSGEGGDPQLALEGSVPVALSRVRSIR